jgi:tight adherence protein B
MLVQNVDTSAYPDVSFTIVLPPGSVGVPGGVPEVSIMENGDEIETVSVTSLAEERQPIDVVLLIDTSGSMKGRPLADAKIAAKRFVEAMGPEDQIAVVGFSSEPRVMLDFTSDRGQLVSVIDQLSAAGETALYDGLVRSASLAGASPATERYIVALSDGGDTMSISTADAAARALRDSRTPVYAVALESPEYSPATLETIARVSGGRSTSVKDSGSLASIYQSIAEEMQQRYRVTYRSTRPNTPQLELAVSALRGDRTLQATAVTANPVFEAGTFAVPGRSSPGPRIPRCWHWPSRRCSYAPSCSSSPLD